MISIDRSHSQESQLQRNYATFKLAKMQEYSHHHPPMALSDLAASIVRDWNLLTPSQQLAYTSSLKPTLPLNLNFQPKNTITPGKHEQLHELASTESRKSAKNGQGELDPQAQEELRVNLAMTEEMQGLGKAKKEEGETRRMGYIQFYQGQYAKYAREHPKWTSQQISIIIKLLWKNRQNKAAVRVDFKEGRPEKSKKIVSGRKAYLMAKGKKGMLGWKKLPLESRLMWNRRGNPNLPIVKANPSLRLSSNPSGLGFMNGK